eukprot:4875277-Pleurochrysis_carterae.AAC.4
MPRFPNYRVAFAARGFLGELEPCFFRCHEKDLPAWASPHAQSRAPRSSFAQVRFIVCELVLALAHMHSHRIVYRDLKPANVLIDEDGHVRMVDMGMASRLDPDGRRARTPSAPILVLFASPLVRCDAVALY